MDGKNPHEAYSGKKPSLANFKVFRIECFVNIRNDEQTMLESESCKCIFLGYDMELKGYQIYDPQARKVLLSQDLVFQEESHQMEVEWPSP